MKHRSTSDLYSYRDKQRDGSRAPGRNSFKAGPIRHLLGNTFVVCCGQGARVPLRTAGTGVCAMLRRDLKSKDFLSLFARARPSAGRGLYARRDRRGPCAGGALLSILLLLASIISASAQSTSGQQGHFAHYQGGIVTNVDNRYIDFGYVSFSDSFDQNGGTFHAWRSTILDTQSSGCRANTQFSWAGPLICGVLNGPIVDGDILTFWWATRSTDNLPVVFAGRNIEDVASIRAMLPAGFVLRRRVPEEIVIRNLTASWNGVPLTWADRAHVWMYFTGGENDPAYQMLNGAWTSNNNWRTLTVRSSPSSKGWVGFSQRRLKVTYEVSFRSGCILSTAGTFWLGKPGVSGGQRVAHVVYGGPYAYGMTEVMTDSGGNILWATTGCAQVSMWINAVMTMMPQ